jgi:flagellar biosynthesis/type III secretory pathway M-ring protein FliF/YscJ
MGDELDIGQGEDGDEMGADREKAKFDLSGEDMKEDLSTLIKDNPEAAVNLLKAWIGDAA